MMPKQCDVFLIDGFSLLYRAYYGYPPNLTTPNNVPINAVYGFLIMMLNAITQFKPKYFGICLDRKEPTYRNELFPDYKANRSAPDEEFLVQLPEFRRLLAPFNVPLIEFPGYESDDLLGALSDQFSAQGYVTYIMSGDLDLLQLVNDHTIIVNNKKGVSNYILYDDAQVFERYSLKPTQIIDFKALKGDASDNIPGVKGIGEKTAISLLTDFQSLENIYDHLDEIKSKSVVKKLTENKDMAFISQKLVRINLESPIDVSLDDLEWQPSWDNVQLLFKEYQFKSLLTKVTDMSGIQESTEEKDLISVSNKYHETYFQVIDDVGTLQTLIPLLKKGFAFDLETSALDPQNAEIVAISITASKGISFVLDCRMDTFSSGDLFGSSGDKQLHPLFTMLIPLFEDSSIPKILHNAKYEYQVLHYHNIMLKGIHFDTMMAAYLLDSRRAIGLKKLAYSLFEYEMVSFDDMLGDHESILNVPFDTLASYVADDSNVTFQLYERFNAQMTDKLRSLFFDLEMPLITVLANMELAGVQCDINYLKTLSKDYTVELKALETKIYELSGNDSFNINSTQQLGEVLFDQMGLPVIKKTKTSRSTDSYVLEKLAKDYEIADYILKYRTYKKLLSTYIDSLPELVHPNSQKIHASFNQAVTATGRLSSNHPNLQNIPVRSMEGQKIRCAFISRFKVGEIIAVDYSQIELRVLAHLANDSAMIEAFKKGHDIHQATAAKLFDIDYDQVTKQQREQAKTVNFGITYGQSAFALADQLTISRAEAQSLIDQYFGQFSKIKRFMDDTIQYVRDNGFVETMFGRIRMIDDIDSPNRSVQGNAQRIAINTRVQGSAADIMKKAMNLIAQEMTGYKSKMIMQVHDELVFDVAKNESDKLLKMVVKLMSAAVELDVPLLVDVETGLSWGNVN